MRPEEMEPGEPRDWLRHAWSDLELARVQKNSRILLEDLCFHAQQAVEKAVKAVLVFKSIPFPKTHNIRTLIDLLPEELNLPE
jgi:HEPN domain-containing protein